MDTDTAALAAPLASKLSLPRLPTTLVARERLLAQLDQAAAYRLTLLSAATGWGKTTLLSAWAARQPHPVAWLSLDELDNEPTRFWVAVIAALRNLAPGVGQTALAMLQTADPAPLEAALTALLHDLATAEAPRPLLLVLDDYQQIDDPVAHARLVFVLEHLPPGVHLLLASRSDPELPLARWRARGELLEIRAEQLRFSPAEAHSLLTSALGEHVGESEAELLYARTEGWGAGLHLAALAMRQRADRAAFVAAFSGAHRYLFDYLQEEVLARLSPRLQRFLLHVAVLRRLDSDLCAAVAATEASQALLLELERQNLFVVPLDDKGRVYRLHDLFREVLLARLHAAEPALVPVLHRRAARWYAAQGDPHEAIGHALAGELYAKDRRVMTNHQTAKPGRASTVARPLAPAGRCTIGLTPARRPPPPNRLRRQSGARSWFSPSPKTKANNVVSLKPSPARSSMRRRQPGKDLHDASANQRGPVRRTAGSPGLAGARQRLRGLLQNRRGRVRRGRRLYGRGYGPGLRPGKRGDRPGAG